MPPKKTKPNKPCPCGSGKKHKKCCMMKDQMTAGARGGNGGRGTTARIPSAVAASTPIIEREAETGMNTNGNSGTKIIAEADLSRILLLLESEEEDGVQRFRAGGSSHARSGGNRNTPNNNSENENEEKKATVAVTSASTGTDDDDNGGGSTGYATKKYLRTPSSSSLPVTSSTVTTVNATENVAAATLPSRSLSLMTLSEVQTEDATLIAITTASPTLPPAGAAAAKLPPSPPQQQPSMLDTKEECVLCAYPLPVKDNESFYFACCGETICNGCIVGQDRVLVIGTNMELPIKDSKEEKREFLKTLLSEVPMPCPFCRAEIPTNTEGFLERLWKRINKYKDPEAMISMGFSYMKGEQGLTKNLAKAEELFKQAYDLGHSNAAYFLMKLYSEHIPDQARMMKYLKEGVMRGHPACMLKMAGCAVESNPPNLEAVVRLTMIAAHLGDDDAIQHLMACYQNKWLSKEGLATTLRAHKAANDKGRTEPREYAKRRKTFEEKLIARGNLRAT